MAHVAVTSLLRTIELEFFQYQPRPLLQDQEKIITGSKDLIDSLRESLRFMQSILEEFDANGPETLPRELETKLRDVALKAEDEIESELSRIYLTKPKPIALVPLGAAARSKKRRQQPSSSGLRQVLQRAVNDIDHIKEDLVKIKDNDNRNNQAEDVAQARKLVSVDGVLPKYDSDESSEEIMVGKRDEPTVMTKLLTEGLLDRQVVSVEGMGGIGKTWLARRVYEDASIKSHFDKRAWVVISQHHNKKQMLLRLLNSILHGGAQNDSMSTDAQIALEIYQNLKQHRYLIVMDDVWSNTAWDDVKACFPDDKNGSRVLLTTRLKEVAEHAGPENVGSHRMRLLDADESWELFYKKLLLEKRLDPEFKRIGRKVVEKCHGLPLAVVVTAGLFSKLETLDELKNVEKALDSLVTATIAERCSHILSLSYNHLPHHLKSCFLYFGFFPKNNGVIVKNLTKLWTAEGIIKEVENESFEGVGEWHLQELIDRNLVLVGEGRSSYGKMWSCTMHDLLYDLSVREAQKENLLYVVGEQNGSGQMDSSTNDCRWITAQRESYSDPSLYASFSKCRSFIYFEEKKDAIRLMKHNIEKKILGPRIHISDLLQASPKLKLLRVLDLSTFECIHELNNLCNWIADLVHLRFLCLIIGLPMMNLKLSKARNLHTLHIQAGYQMDNAFRPFDLGDLPQLRYIKCWPRCELIPPMFVHKNLQSISWISPKQCSEQVFAKIPHIRKLNIKGERKDFIANGKNLGYLHELESLSIDFGRFSSLQRDNTPKNSILDIVSLQSLKKLKLWCTEFKWKDVNVLATLPKLQVLKLAFQACLGREWKLTVEDEEQEEKDEEQEENDKEQEEDEELEEKDEKREDKEQEEEDEELEEEIVFRELKFLLIDYSSLKEWKATGENFPNLERLILLRCFNLKKIPSGFADIYTLHSIELRDCLPSVVTSAKKIEEKQHDYGNSIMEVVVHHRPSSNAGASIPNEAEASSSSQPTEDFYVDEEPSEELRFINSILRECLPNLKSG